MAHSKILSTKLALIGLCAMMVSGCAGMMPPAKRNVAFDEEMFKSSIEPGTATITGQAFLKTRSGEVKFGAGNEVVCVPVNAYTIETQQRTIIGGENLEAPDSRYAKYRRVTQADGSGNFQFSNLPAGEYFISCIIQWEYATSYGPMPTGGVAYVRVKVNEGETVKVVATR